MYQKYATINEEKPTQEEGDQESLTIKLNEEEMAILADRALLLLSFKDTPTQNLRYVMNVLGIRTLEEKKKVLQQIYRLIREGIVYVPKGLPQLVDQGSLFGTDNSSETENIDLCLLRPYEQIIREIQNEIIKLQTRRTPTTL